VFRRKISRKRDGNFLQPDKGAFFFIKDSLILSSLAVKRGVMSGPLKFLTSQKIFSKQVGHDGHHKG
jgi:hypothetical protein